MLFDYIRIIQKDGTGFTDISYENQDESLTPSFDLDNNEFFLIGMEYPFNNFFVDIDTANENPANMTISAWDGNKWNEVVDVLDGTKLNNASFGKSGHVLFALDKQKSGWGRVNNPQVQGPDELTTLKIYDLYWLKVEFSGSLDAETKIRELGFAWTTGSKMKAIKAEVDRYLPSFAQGKSNWNPEIMTACKMMTTDFKKANLILGPQQVVRMDDFWLPATYKSLWLIYSSLGPAYLETANAMAHQYYKTMNVDNITLDENRDGRVSSSEKDSRVKVGVR